VTEAAHGGEIVIIAIPKHAVVDLPTDLFIGVPNDVVVIDTGNYCSARDGRIAAIEEGQVEGVWVAEQLARPVVKVFNNTRAKSLLENGRPAGAAGRIALPVAGDPPDARRSQNALPAAWLVAVGRKNRYRNASRLLSPVIESVDAAYSAACGS
jgi:predicted dinucleotide-binding enzyme